MRYIQTQKAYKTHLCVFYFKVINQMPIYVIIPLGKVDTMNKTYLAYSIIGVLTLIYLFMFSSYFLVLVNMSPVLFNLISSILVFFYLDIAYKLYFKKYQLYKTEIFFVFLTYISVFIYLLFFKTSDVVDSSTLDLIPLFFHYQSGLQYIILVGNILLFLPIGYFYYRYNFKYSFIFILVSSFLIEGMQYFFKVGVFDLSDIILYIIGFYIGFGYFHIRKKYSERYQNISYDISQVFTIYLILFVLSFVLFKVFFA